MKKHYYYRAARHFITKLLSMGYGASTVSVTDIIPPMNIAELYAKQQCPISFEIFPPKEALSHEAAYSLASELAQLKPDFISVTFSAGGGGNSGATIDIAHMIQEDLATPSMAHLTCINMTHETLEEYIGLLKKKGIKNILALRGDCPEGLSAKDYSFAKDLIPRLADEGFCVGAAAYPEGHVECSNPKDGIKHLKEKQDAGASFFITQLFFDNDYFYRFWEEAQRAGIKLPISCGIMPFMSKAQTQRMVLMCGASLPEALIKLLEKYEDDPRGLQQAGIEYAAEQLLDLADHGVDGLHIYTMNKPHIAKTHMQVLREHQASAGMLR